jgi:glycosyltransferase involved in cell wall biosynthesis
MPLVSVVMPAKNAENTLHAAVRSILRQDMEDFELIAVDDGSDDKTLSALGHFAAKDRRVRVIPIKSSGIVEALNTGLAEARGTLVARMDADDFAHPQRLGLQAGFLKKNSGISIVSSLVRLFPRSRLKPGMLYYESWVNSVVSPGEIARDLFVESPHPHPAVMFRKSDIAALGDYRDMGWPEDYDLWLRASEAGLGMAKLPNTLLWWRDGSRRLSRDHGMYTAENFRKVKAHFLYHWRLAGARKLQIWGAGRDGKTWAKLLIKTGFEIVQFIDIDRKKVGGQACGGIPVVWPADIIKGMPILCAVGVKGARQQIRDYLSADGFNEPGEFMFLS